MNEVTKLIGSAADNDNANRQRRFRERQKELALQESYESVTKNNESKSIEIDKDKDIDIDKDIEKRERIDYQLIVDMYNDTCVSFPRVTTLSDARKKAIKARLNTHSIDDFKRMFEIAESSDFLKGGNNRNWSANFDWLIKDSNMAKVLDGNYSQSNYSQPRTKGEKVAQELNNFYDMAKDWAEKEE